MSARLAGDWSALLRTHRRADMRAPQKTSKRSREGAHSGERETADAVVGSVVQAASQRRRAQKGVAATVDGATGPRSFKNTHTQSTIVTAAVCRNA